MGRRPCATLTRRRHDSLLQPGSYYSRCACMGVNLDPRQILSRKLLRLCRRRPEERDLPGQVTASDAIMEEMCRAGASVAQAAAAKSATPSAALSAELLPAQTATQSAAESASAPTPLQTRHVERPRQYIHKAGQYMRQAMRKSLGHLQ